LSGLSVDADIAADFDLLGKYVSDLQEDIEFGEFGISGTLKYVTGYTGWSGDVSEQSGNYLALHFEVEDVADAVITVQLSKGKHGAATLDSDGICIFRIEDAAQEIIVTASKSGYETATMRIPIHGLTLEEE
jgi:hypothetical protein